MIRWLMALVALVVVFGGIFGGKAWMDRRAAQAAAAQSWPAAAVTTAPARLASWDTVQRVIGTLRAVEGTEITAQVAGNVTEIAFESGTTVRKGDLLVQLDNSTQLAALHADEARLAQKRIDMERARRLYRDRAISAQQAQNAELDYKLAAAAVESNQALLAKLRITAPFDGVLGIRKVSVGQYVAPGTAIVDLQRWDPMLVDFALPQEFLGQLAEGQPVQFTVDAWPGRNFAGRVTALAAQVDADTRNLGVQATLDNAQALLRPGLFGHASLTLGQARSGVAVPHGAIAYSTFGNTVYVVTAGEQGKSVAQARVVEVLAERDGEVLLATGVLQDGDEVVVAGQHKLRDGAPVQVAHDQDEKAGR